jgi:hypothetical protein
MMLTAPPSPIAGVTRSALSLVSLLVLAWVTSAALRHVAPPAPAAGDGGASAFSATLAMQDVAEIARAPHPIGTDDAVRVRSYLMARLVALGYAPQIQEGEVVEAPKRLAARVRNIVLRIPGTTPGKALMLVAHYDSAPGSPGAADDGASVASILETLRVLKSGPPLRNDLIVLFSDGEEAGLLGAGLFARQHPWAKDVGVALNFEYRGNAGPVWMFDTSERNGRLVREWQAAVPGALGSSLLHEVYRLMPNDTDLTALKPTMPGMNFAAGDRYNSYHTALDNARALDRATLQQQGDMMVALARRFGGTPLDAMQDDSVVYFDLAGVGVISYGTPLALAAAALVVAGFAALTLLATRRGQARPRRVLKAAGAVLATCVLLAVVCQLAWLGLRLVHPGYQLLLHGSTYNGGWYLAAFAVLSAALFVAALGGLQRWFAPWDLILGALALVVLGLVATSVALPGATFLFTWPTLPILAALAVVLLVPRVSGSEVARALLLLVAAVPALLLFVPMIRLLFVALTPLLLAAVVFVASLLYCVIGAVLLPLARPRWLTLAALGASLALFAGGAATSGFDAEHPQPDNLFYVQDGAAGPAWLVSDDEDLDAWTRGLLGPSPRHETLPAVFGPTARPIWARTTPAQFTTAPDIDVVSDRSEGGLRHLALSVRSPRHAARMVIAVDGAPVQEATVQGQAYTGKETAGWRVETFGMGDDPVRVALTVKAGTSFAVRVRDISYGLAPAAGTRPEGLMAQPFRGSDTAQVARVLKFQ